MNRTKHSSRGWILGALLAIGTLSLGVSAYQQPPAAGGGRGRGGPEGPKLIEVGEAQRQPVHAQRRRRQHAVFVTANGVVVVDTKIPGWGQPLLDKIKELTDKPVTTHHQHAHAFRPRGRQRGVSRQRWRSSRTRTRRPTWRRACRPPASEQLDASRRVQGTTAGTRQADLQGQDDDWQGQRPDRSLLLRTWPHQRRRLGRVSGAARDARRRHLLRQDCRCSTRTTAAAAWRSGHAREGGDRSRMSTRSSPATAR